MTKITVRGESEEHEVAVDVALPLFVYGIFLSATARREYGMGDVRYEVVNGYSTREVVEGSGIVEAFPCKGHSLTGLLVDTSGMDKLDWFMLDKLERRYDRKIVQTSGGNAYMYVAKEK